MMIFNKKLILFCFLSVFLFVGAAFGQGNQQSASVSVTPGSGFSVYNDDFRLNIRGRMILRDTVFYQNSGTVAARNELTLPNLRVILSGNFFGRNNQFFIQTGLSPLEFESDTSSPVLDAYLRFTQSRDVNVTVGQMLVPFDRMPTICPFANQMAGCSLASNEFALGRDMGVHLHSNNLFGLNNLISYNVGVFGGSGRNHTNPGTGLMYVGRLQINPFGEFDDYVEGDLQRLNRVRLALGVAGAWNHQTNRQRSTSGNVYTQGLVDYTHLEADLVFKYGGFSLLSEFLYRQANVDRLPMTGTNMAEEWTRSGYGYFVQAGYMLTSRLEVVSRFGQMFATNTTDPSFISLVNRSGNELGGALNLYLNGHSLKIQTDYFYMFGTNNWNNGMHQVRTELVGSF